MFFQCFKPCHNEQTTSEAYCIITLLLSIFNWHDSTFSTHPKIYIYFFLQEGGSPKHVIHLLLFWPVCDILEPTVAHLSKSLPIPALVHLFSQHDNHKVVYDERTHLKSKYTANSKSDIHLVYLWKWIFTLHIHFREDWQYQICHLRGFWYVWICWAVREGLTLLRACTKYLCLMDEACMFSSCSANRAAWKEEEEWLYKHSRGFQGICHLYGRRYLFAQILQICSRKQLRFLGKLL